MEDVQTAPLCQVTALGSMSRRAKRVTSSSVRAAGSVFSMPSLYTDTETGEFEVTFDLHWE